MDRNMLDVPRRGRLAQIAGERIRYSELDQFYLPGVRRPARMGHALDRHKLLKPEINFGNRLVEYRYHS